MVAEPGIIVWETACAMGVPAPPDASSAALAELAGPGLGPGLQSQFCPRSSCFIWFSGDKCSHGPAVGLHAARALGSPLGSAFSRGARARTHRSGPGCGATRFFPLTLRCSFPQPAVPLPRWDRSWAARVPGGPQGRGQRGGGSGHGPTTLSCSRPGLRSGPFWSVTWLLSSRPAPGCSPQTPAHPGLQGSPLGSAGEEGSTAHP